MRNHLSALDTVPYFQGCHFLRKMPLRRRSATAVALLLVAGVIATLLAAARLSLPTVDDVDVPAESAPLKIASASFAPPQTAPLRVPQTATNFRACIPFSAAAPDFANTPASPLRIGCGAPSASTLPPLFTLPTTSTTTTTTSPKDHHRDIEAEWRARVVRVAESAAPVHVPLVAVVVPCFSQRAYETVPETLGTLARQLLPNVEVIIVDDGSTDAPVQPFRDAIAAALVSEQLSRSDQGVRDVYEAVRALVRSGRRVCFAAHEQRLGLAAARNSGAALASLSVEFVYFLDADDLLEPSALEHLVWCLVSHPLAHWCGQYVVAFGQQNYTWIHGFGRGADFLSDNFAVASALLRRTSFLAVNGYTERTDPSVAGHSLHGVFLEDWEFWLRCASHGMWGRTASEFLFWYRRKAVSLSTLSHSTATDWKLTVQDGASARTWADVWRERFPALSVDTFPLLPSVDSRAWRVPRSPALLQLWRDAHRAGSVPVSNSSTLFFVPWFKLGGVDRWLWNTVEALAGRYGYAVTLVATHSDCGNRQADFARLTGDIHCLAAVGPSEHWPHYVEYLIASRRVGTIWLVNSEWGFHSLPWLRAVSSTRGAALLTYVHMEEEHWRDGGYARYAVNFAELLDGIVASSEHLRRFLVAMHDETFAEHAAETSGLYHVVPIGVDDSVFHPKATSATVPPCERELVVLFAARFVDQKAPWRVLEIVKILCERFTARKAACDTPASPMRLHVVFAGHGELEAEVRASWDQWLHAQQGGKCANGAVEVAVTFRGAVDLSDMPALVRSADVLLLPSKMEGVASVVYESMASGVVVVTSAAGGQREVVSNAGLLVAASDDIGEAAIVAAYADRLEWLLHNWSGAQVLADAALRDVRRRWSLARAVASLVTVMDHAWMHAHARMGASPQPPAWAALLVTALRDYDERLSSTWQALEALRRTH
jgi:glycosyltransferase involved in cell wall biosynthesis